MNLAAGIALAAVAGTGFYDVWGDGRGEVNVYRLTEERYAEPHRGTAVLVYVTEDLNASTHVKVERKEPQASERRYVLKLNTLRKFPTGLYDYATETTVFSAVEPGPDGEAWTALRVVTTTQEWCGQVWERLDLGQGGWRHELKSYFESEGDQSRLLPAEGAEVEDNLWIRIRELGEPWLAPGESAPLLLYPALWERRKTHGPLVAAPATIRKRAIEPITTPLGTIDSAVWTWTLDDRMVTVFVEAGGAHRVLGWEDSRGGKAELIASERVAYWELNDDHADPERRRFNLPDLTPPRAPGTPRG